MRVRLRIGFAARFMTFKPFAMAQPTGIPSGKHIEDIRTGSYAKPWVYPIPGDPHTTPPREFQAIPALSADQAPKVKITWKDNAGQVVSSAPNVDRNVVRNSLLGGVFFRGVGLDPEDKPITGPLVDALWNRLDPGGGPVVQQFTRTWTETTTETWTSQGTEFANQTVATHTQVCYAFDGTAAYPVGGGFPPPILRWRVAWFGADNRLWLSLGESVRTELLVQHTIAEETTRQWIIGADGTRRTLYAGMPSTVSRSSTVESRCVMQQVSKATVFNFAINPAYALHNTARWTGLTYRRDTPWTTTQDKLSDFVRHQHPEQIDYVASQTTVASSGTHREKITSDLNLCDTLPGAIPNPAYPIAAFSRQENQDGIERLIERTSATAFPVPIAAIEDPAWRLEGASFSGAEPEATVEHILGPLGLAGGTFWPDESQLPLFPLRGDPVAATITGATIVAASGFNSRPGASARTLTSENGAEVTADLRVDATDTDDATKASLRWIVEELPTYPDGIYGGGFSLATSTATGARGECRWTPPAGWYGTTYAKYRICDGYDFSNPITLTLVSEQT